VCGRYYSRYSKQQLAERLRTRVGFAIFANYNLSPATFQPVVRLDGEGVREAVVMRWGLVPYWSKDA
jgi:putative SOS response-associated peptidase YedK